jgi:Holliday junction resolvase RusA-like endonuclease
MPEPMPREAYSAIPRIEFIIDGNPVPKARPRVTQHGTFTPQATKDWEALVGWSYRQANGPLFPGLVRVVMHFYYRRKRSERVDIDNLIKSVLDGLNKVAWDDDAQVRFIMADLAYVKEDPRVEMSIEEWKETQ